MLQADTQLNELGLQQADLVGQRLANESYDAIYSSDLSRCKQVGFQRLLVEALKTC
jgi:broad specificity phosphatase PhoE